MLNLPSPSGFSPTRSGFTLVETLIVVVCIAIAAAIALPAFRQAPATQLNAAAHLLEADLNYAQVQSKVHRHNLRSIVFDTDENAYHLATADNLDEPITHPAGHQPYRLRWGSGRAGSLPGIRWGELDLDEEDRLSFGPYGEPEQTSDANIELICDDRALTLTVAAFTGQITISDLHPPGELPE